MAQLVKLQDYVSRYTADPYRYPGQFIRLKQGNWKKLKSLWNRRFELEESEYNEALSSFIYKGAAPKNEQELKQYFLDGLLPFQLKWASRTLTEMSFLDKTYEYDETLRYLLQRFPDTFLLLYDPIFQIKKAPMEADSIIVHPQGIYCVKHLQESEDVTYIPGDERSWYKEEKNVRTRFLSPLISLKRTARIIQSILKAHGIEYPVKQLVLSSTNRIEYNLEPYQTEYVGLEEYEEWFERMRGFKSPLKYQQMKVMASLLKHTQVTSVKRTEWGREESFMEE
ncbi:MULTISPECIES: nuclease-related domain-containing protein [Pontibacillus]|uniref:Nuclease-related domain-containing protein n=1 Tax=Pontibacillus chungwhensis TaxID=265426 RepID=A0ABY8V066_9BACI|nr:MULTISPECIES: nuclease-related domain-containing protein [Pontibacillus]MCD5323916.1 NERD domain-containing protein [Pontibacillus sp. HN14]WIF97271.1 nuclease-related domain-containing protein [Pontibacillus chungwhensis]